ncbi:MAG: hypothetical protein QOJ50_1407 [Cryptosporangiaceae bacterium]|nr:hypothetical protein [Cryptosporangiaceae bacterium]
MAGRAPCGPPRSSSQVGRNRLLTSGPRRTGIAVALVAGQQLGHGQNVRAKALAPSIAKSREAQTDMMMIPMIGRKP